MNWFILFLLLWHVESKSMHSKGFSKSDEEDKLVSVSISFEKFNRYDEIIEYIQQVDKKYGHVKAFQIGNTYENRLLAGVKISSGGSVEDKPVIIVDGGIHAREWLSVSQVLYIIYQLAENPDWSDLYRNVDWYILPLLNPDGYEYSHVHDRYWRKNRAPSSTPECIGTDLNRNFGFHWNEVDEVFNNDECSDIYVGSSPFSELETQNFRRFISNLRNVRLYLTFHSFGQNILYPWGWTSAYPHNKDELNNLGEAASEAIRDVRGTVYLVGSTSNVVYPASGGSDDWMKGMAGVPLAYTIELPSGGKLGFNPPANAIKGIVAETWEGVVVFAQFIELKYAT